MYKGQLVKYNPSLSKISLTESKFNCISCNSKCHEFVVINKKDIGKGSGTYRLIRCLNCIFWGPYYVYHSNENDLKVVPPNDYECHDFISDQCDPDSIGSINWDKKLFYKGNNDDIFSGGNPIWLQDDERPICPECKNKMEFIFQLPSSAIDTIQNLKELSESFTIGIEYYAIIYYFYCNNCNISCSITQND